MKEENKPTIGAVVLKCILAVLFSIFVLVWIAACVGNFLNVGDNPAPTLIKW